MNSKKFFCVEIKSDSEFEEKIFSFLNEFEHLGIWEKNEKNLNIYFSYEPKLFVKKIKNLYKSYKISYFEYKDRNWVLEYQKKLKPIKVGKKFVIYHFSEKDKVKNYKPKRREIIKLIPGLAFGTGEHFTTASCIEILEKIIPFPSSIIDIGTGSGILAITAFKLGAKNISCLDNDFDACRVAKESFILNSLKINIACSTADAFKGEYDLVIANILYETIVEISDRIDGLCSKNGKILLSGIRSEKEEILVKLFEDKRFFLIEALRDENWSTLLFSRKTIR